MSDDSHTVAELVPRGVAGLRQHQWKPGQSGNPRGRPPRGFATVDRIRSAIAEELPQLLEVVLQKALAGDMAACKLLFDKCIPSYRVMEKPVQIPGLTGSLAEAGAAILAAVGRGDIAPGQGSQLLLGMGAQARVIELDALERRIAELQAWREEKAKEPDEDADDPDDEDDADGE